MKERAKALLSKNKNELSVARTFYVSLDRADNVIEGGPAFGMRFWRVPQSLPFEGYALVLVFVFQGIGSMRTKTEARLA
jgi:hypothetical protein